MAGGGLLSLKWNNHCSTFLHILSSLHKKQTYHDATVACGGILYPVHKIVLSTCSEYFEEMFDSIYDKHPIIVLKDIKGEVFEALLKYMYIGEVNVIQDRLSDLINAAECLKIKGLAVPDEDPSASTVRSSSRPSGGNGSNSSKRRHDQSDSIGSAPPPSKIHKSSKNVSNSGSVNNKGPSSSNRSLDPKSRENITREDVDVQARPEVALFSEDEEVIEEFPVKQEREDYDEDSVTTDIPKQKAPQEHEEIENSQQALPEEEDIDTENLSKVEIIEEGGESNSADQWTGDNMGEEGDNFGYMGDSNSGGADEMMGMGQEAEGGGDDNNEGNGYFETSLDQLLKSDIPSSSSSDPHNLPQQSRVLHEEHGSFISQETVPVLSDSISSTSATSYGIQSACVNSLYYCSFCNFVTPIKTALVIHIRRHTGEKPFACQYCFYRTGNKYHLKSHITRHKDEYKFFCQFCSYKSKYKNALKYHLAGHHNPAKITTGNQ